MAYKCPICDKEFDVADLKQPGGIGGGSYCPHCGGRVYVSFAYGGIVALGSPLICIRGLAPSPLGTIFWFIIGIILIFDSPSFFLNTLSVCFKPPPPPKR